MFTRSAYRLLMVLAALLALATARCISPTLPLPPPNREGLTVDPPNPDGEVRVAGDEGVMDVGEQAVIINQNTLHGWIVPVEETGFEVWVLAQEGDRLTLQRRLGEALGQAIELIVPGPASP